MKTVENLKKDFSDYGQKLMDFEEDLSTAIPNVSTALGRVDAVELKVSNIHLHNAVIKFDGEATFISV